MRISDWSSDVCSSDLAARHGVRPAGDRARGLIGLLPSDLPPRARPLTRFPGRRAPTCFPGRSEAEIRGPPLHLHRPATVRRPAWAPDLRAARSVRGSRQWGSRADPRATFLAKRGGAAITTSLAVHDPVIHPLLQQEPPSPPAAPQTPAIIPH